MERRCGYCGRAHEFWLCDLFCGAGGAGMGYHEAGFGVVGVDLRPQPNYPFEFHQGDALDFPLAGFDAIHASPPCLGRSRATGPGRHAYPKLIGPTRARLAAAGVPYVIENVPPVRGAEPLTAHLKLCACMFDMPPELRRERWFETRPMLFDLRPPCRHEGPGISVNCKGGRYNGPGPRHDTYISLAECRRIMGIHWMSQRELGLAIPPPYTRYLGRLLLDELDERRRLVEGLGA